MTGCNCRSFRIGISDAINAASILPNLLRDYGDLPEVLGEVSPRPILLAAPSAAPEKLPASVRRSERRFTAEPSVLLDWLGK